MARYREYMAPPITATVRPSSACAAGDAGRGRAREAAFGELGQRGGIGVEHPGQIAEAGKQRLGDRLHVLARHGGHQQVFDQFVIGQCLGPAAQQARARAVTLGLAPLAAAARYWVGVLWNEDPRLPEPLLAELRKQRLAQLGKASTLFSRASRSLWLGLLVSIVSGVFSLVPLLLRVFAPRRASSSRIAWYDVRVAGASAGAGLGVDAVIPQG